MPITIAALANALTASLARHDISAMSREDTDAVDRLARAVTYDLRQQIAARQRELWFESAILDPPAGTLTRTVIVNSNACPDWISQVALVQRTDTGQHYIVSTTCEIDEETLTWRSDADGNRYPHPEYPDRTEDPILAVGGRRMTRTEAITAIDQASASALANDWSWYDDDDESESESESESE